jgi:hypothetical protein
MLAGMLLNLFYVDSIPYTEKLLTYVRLPESNPKVRFVHLLEA